VPAQYHGRPGKAGRPKNPAQALLELAYQATDPRMKALALEAARRAYSMSELAARFASPGYDASALTRSVLAQSPRVSTVTRLAKVLGYNELTQHALVNELTPGDEREALRRLDQLIVSRSHSAIHPQFASVGDSLREKIAAAPTELRRKVLADMIVADIGLYEGDALELVAENLGVEFLIADPRQLRENQRQVYASFLWLAKVLNLNVRARKGLASALKPYFKDFPILEDLILQRSLDLESGNEVRISTQALTAARNAFVDDLYGSPKFVLEPGIRLEYLREDHRP
jgi:hypothetical protein